LDPTIVPGENYTISVYTDYAGSDVAAWDLSLTFNPSVLRMGFDITDIWIGDGVAVTFTASKVPVVEFSEEVYVNQILMTRFVDYTMFIDTGELIFTTAPSLGAEIKAEYTWTGVVNGNLITAEKHSGAIFLPGTFDNTVGRLSMAGAFFNYASPPPPTTSGPGTFANITFRVVGYGSSNVTLGQETKLWGPAQPPDYLVAYKIIDAMQPPGRTEPPYGSDHIGHGYFENINDVAITNLVTPTTAILGDLVAINVTIANKGSAAATYNITVYANTTLIGNQTDNNLPAGEVTTLPFIWDTTAVAAGNYTINATARLPPGDNPSDNSRNATIEIKTLHDVAVTDLEVSDAFTGDLVPVKVTVANQGTFEENVNLTIYYQSEIAHTREVVNTTSFSLGKRPTSAVIQTNWNTTSLNIGICTINATITIIDALYTDEDLSDNMLPKLVTLSRGHDVAIDLSVTSKVFVGETVAINVTVQNVGGLDEGLVKVNVTSGTVAIGSQQTPSLTVGDSVTFSFTWSTTGLSPGIYAIEAEAISDKDEEPANNLDTKTTVVAEPIGIIAGTVKDTSGNPIEGVSVTCGNYANITHANGSYRLSNILAGDYTVTASKNGYQTSSQQGIIVVAGQTTNLNFTLTLLPTTGHIIGTVTDATGNPIEGVLVTAGSSSASTNATGDYSIELPAGNYTVTVSASGYESSSKTDVNVVAGATTTVNFILKPSEPSNILLYAAAAIVIGVFVTGTAVYLRKRKRTA
jgi:hypothetical protein